MARHSDSVEKLIEALRKRPPSADFADVRKVLEAYGWEQTRQKGSHVTFWKAGEPRSMTIPLTKGNQVKGSYVRLVMIRLGLDEYKEQ